MEKIDIDIPVKFRKEINDILLDTPEIVHLGGTEFKVHKLRPFAIHRIYQVGLRLMQDNDEILENDKKFLGAFLTDINACAEVLAIILCNHLFDADNVNSFEEMFALKSRNERLIEYMKDKVLMSTSEIGQWSAIIIGAFNSLNIQEVFRLRTSVKEFTVSQTMIRKAVAEQLQSWREAQLEIVETS